MNPTWSWDHFHGRVKEKPRIFAAIWLQMKISHIIFSVFLVVGCKEDQKKSVSIEISNPYGFTKVNFLTAVLSNSPTFKNLNRQSEKSLIAIGKSSNEWVEIEIGNITDELFHRWATFRLNEQTGEMLKLGTDTNLEDEWTVEVKKP